MQGLTYFAVLFFTLVYTSVNQEVVGDDDVVEGIASYYHNSLHGLPTASGEVYDTAVYSAAHKSLELGSYVMVNDIIGKQSIVVKVNDRLPQSSTRLIDLSWAAASSLKMIEKGLLKVEMKSISAQGASQWFEENNIPKYRQPLQ
ncbi:septal ring lytic transglycosylase RlpA family protein [Membranihabitans marinus]|uniref:septal ring lytic transglycosylase RlpA family protein n=1 Tax=Membranihabitans marinus TaxID=1227546 RepID=UPI001F37B9E6|nr:septal ring lytic transglycosylase RlpA family protein [Membranihabitans marinus]